MCREYFFTLKTETAGSSKTYVTLYQTIRRHIPEGRNLDTAVRTSDLTLWSPTGRQQVPPKRQYLSTKLHRVTYKLKEIIFIFMGKFCRKNASRWQHHLVYFFFCEV
jgi:hypothetical protein